VFLFKKTIPGDFSRNREGENMNIPTPVKLADLKEGKLYFVEENIYPEKTIHILKIEKTQLESNLKKQIEYSYSLLENYSLFSDITDFNKTFSFHSSFYDFFESHMLRRDLTTSFSFYEFDEEWFLKNKQKMLHMLYYYSKKSFPEIFQEIEKEKI